MLLADVLTWDWLAGGPAALAAGALAAAATVFLALGLWRLRDTTLVAPCLWTLAAIWAAAGVEAVLGIAASERGAGWGDALRFAAAVVSLCPAMAVMGAKRPQNTAWQFVVLSLWVVLALPALEVLVLRPGLPLRVQWPRAWILPVLLLLGGANLLGTRFWPSALLATAAQALLLAPWLPLLGVEPAAWRTIAALALTDLALLLPAVGIPRRRAALAPLDRVWLDFRDRFGVLWSLRVAERVNASAKMYDWNVVLHWDGFSPADAEGTAADLPPDLLPKLRQNLSNLLRRFVSPQWIDRRADEKQ